MATTRTPTPACGLCSWALSLTLLATILALSIFGAGVVTGQMLARSERPSPSVWGGCW